MRECVANPKLKVRAAARKPMHQADGAVECVSVGDIATSPDWGRALTDVDAVIHTAARVHMMRDWVADPLREFRRINVDATLRLARQAADAGVRRFVFVSSIKVNGDATSFERPFRSADPPNPLDSYGVSKWEAEQALRRLSQETGMEVVMVRPPLVYGPGVGANFLRLMRLVQAGAVLPLRSVCNARSLVYVGNLVSALLACVNEPRAAGETYLVRDGEDLSTPELITRIARAFGKRPRLLPMPMALLQLGGRLTRKEIEVDRLTGSLRVDSSHIRDTIGWTPPYSVDEGLAETVRWFESLNAAVDGTQPASA
jgi:nucleoside-diphosphate-sugar epimerase